MKQNFYRLYYLLKLGGWYYVWVGIADKILGHEKARNFLYRKTQKMNPDKYETELTKIYSLKIGKRLNLKNPVTFTEKLQWLKLNDATPLKTTLTDKYLVREWISEKIGAQYLIPILGVWDSFDEIDLSALPKSFVLKTNHGSGWNVIIKDKSNVDWNKVREKFNNWLSLNFAFIAGFQMQYLNITPKIIAEEYIENGNGNLYDYKIHCFDGKPKYIQLMGDRNPNDGSAKQAFYNTDWELQPFTHSKFTPYKTEMERPINLDKMLKAAETLSEGFPYVRVDLYELDNGEIKFGEMTFTPRSGFFQWLPPETDTLWGEKLKLPL